MKNIIITGSTDGIGKLTAIQLAQQGNKVYLHGRSRSKLDSTLKEIKNITKNNSLKAFVADLSNLEEVKKLAQEIEQELDHIDVLINNAGVYNSPVATNKNGLDLRMVVNYLAPKFLTELLLPLLEKSSSPRVINLSSAAQSPVSLRLLKGEESVIEGSAYAQSKLALTMWSLQFAKDHPHIVTIPVNPGSLLNTKMVASAFGQFWSDAEKGSNILSELATGEKHKSHSGDYFDNDSGSYGRAHADAYDHDKTETLLLTTTQVMNDLS